jgi:hypothetical protein
MLKFVGALWVVMCGKIDEVKFVGAIWVVICGQISVV